MVHQNTIYTCATPLQEAVAIGFETEIAKYGQSDSYWKNLASSLQLKRDKMAKSLSEAGMRPTIPEGGYFMLADFSSIYNKLDKSIEDETGSKDYKFVKYMTKKKKLQGIPPSAFYSELHKPLAQNYVRYCFMKKDETLDDAEKILKNLNN
jgi:kynurenine--oxoglutarate transaminase/cysteine-S-conjugate beta-lyase/glutamine--phenylpyruvate transaminase